MFEYVYVFVCLLGNTTKFNPELVLIALIQRQHFALCWGKKLAKSFAYVRFVRWCANMDPAVGTDESYVKRFILYTVSETESKGKNYHWNMKYWK